MGFSKHDLRQDVEGQVERMTDDLYKVPSGKGERSILSHIRCAEQDY